jgi:hypothetical protein
MNKKSILLILLSTLALGANAQGKYTIKGNLQNAEGQKIYLYSGDMGNMDIDSTIIANGKFTLNGSYLKAKDVHAMGMKETTDSICERRFCHGYQDCFDRYRRQFQ